MTLKNKLITIVENELHTIDFDDNDEVERSYLSINDKFIIYYSRAIADDSLTLRDAVFIVCTLDDYYKYDNPKQAYLEILKYLESNDEKS